MADMTQYKDSKYYLLGVDWQEKRLGVPTWGWGLGLAYLAYRFFFRKKR